MTIVLRICIVIVAAGIVAFVLYSALGQPSTARLYDQDEIARFKPSLAHGILQFMGEIFIVALYAFVARRWLRIKL